MEKNLKLLGAILVALAVVFAAGCDSSPFASSLANSTWESSDGKYTLYFASGATFTVTGSDGNTITSGTWSLSGTTLTLTQTYGRQSQSTAVTYYGVDTITIDDEVYTRVS